MKIIELRAENVKRLRAVRITPDGTMQVVGGRNAQGKSSVLDAIWLAIGGGRAAKSTARPIRDGEDAARVTLDLGDLTVTRTWTHSGTNLKVTSPDGAAHSSPQKMLDALVGKMTFDPLEFTRLSTREQRDALLDLVDLSVDLEELEDRRAALYASRTAVGQEEKRLGEVEVDPDLPESEVSMGDAVAALRAAEEEARRAAALREERDNLGREVERLTKDLKDAERRLLDAEEAVDAIGSPADPGPLAARLDTLEAENAAIRANNERRDRAEEKAALRERYDAYTERIAEVDEEKRAALAAAEFPVDGLGFNDGGVTYRGVPFSQASSAEQIRVSLAMAMAANPDLRVIRIMDGSLLDEEAMEAIRAQVADGDFQLWIERVGDADEGAVVIEDGEVQEG